MLNVTKELTALARKLGYTGKAPDTVAKAINAITASVGGGGGGVELFTVTFEERTGTANCSYNDVKAAITNGKTVMFNIVNFDAYTLEYIGQLAHIAKYDDSENGGEFIYNVVICTGVDGGNMVLTSETADGTLSGD